MPIAIGLIAVLLVAGSPVWAAPDLSSLEATFNRIARQTRGEVGVALIHLESGVHFEIRGTQGFPMASVCKLPIALELAKQVSEGRLTLDRQVAIDERDIRPCCTLSRRHPKGGMSMSLGELLELMMVESDNTAADLVLKVLGGPEIVQRRMRGLGLHGIRVDRYEGQMLLDMAGVSYAPPVEQWTLEMQRRLVADVPPDVLNAGRARYLRDPRDMATPYDIARFLGRLKLGDLLPREQTSLLIDLMERATTGKNRLKGRLPSTTVVAHKTGTTDIVTNDVGIITLPPGSRIGGHVVLAVFVADARTAVGERTIAQLGAAAYEFFTGTKLEPPRPPRKTPTRRRQRSR
jgi:beta-lactamase class A